ncbi:Haem-binding domain-containing protein [Chitinophaga ginsengisegetis]|uniref:Haem-binding domain-containing protein n=2 Tax=Chitinophaga ginsengisegetis TaxID=393003 RepID=A0A1T5P9M9_9BACT|nr:heme-binding domain-containing protein [Chitinophaga ginsengisegetis]SKD09303.1 Haem-binding domain-containing protein [Chitinophaga ginsengisegetis]
MTRIILFLLLIIIVAIQFFQPEKNENGGRKSPDEITGLYTIPANVQTILKQACYDCHSNNTRYPWYAGIQPVGWLMAAHIREGKKELNFDEYGAYSSKRQRNKMKRMKEQVTAGKMPLSSYTLIHADARLTTGQKELIANWIDSTLELHTGDH